MQSAAGIQSGQRHRQCTLAFSGATSREETMIGVASKRRSGPRARLAFPFEQCAIGHRALIGSQAAHELVGSRKPTTGRACFKKRSPSQRPHACCLRSAFWRRRHMPQTAASPSAAADRVNAIGSLPTTLEAGFFGSRRGLAGHAGRVRGLHTGRRRPSKRCASATAASAARQLGRQGRRRQRLRDSGKAGHPREINQLLGLACVVWLPAAGC